jgi:hypothetical protein
MSKETGTGKGFYMGIIVEISGMAHKERQNSMDIFLLRNWRVNTTDVGQDSTDVADSGTKKEPCKRTLFPDVTVPFSMHRTRTVPVQYCPVARCL